jgi:hypothetical protein
MAIIDVKYNKLENNDIEYKSIIVSRLNNNETMFNSGDFVKDWYNVIKHCLNNLENEHISYSSSVDSFVIDGAPYDSAYLYLDENEKPILFYPDNINPEKIKESNEFLHSKKDKIELFVNRGEKLSWEQLKDKCK